MVQTNKKIKKKVYRENLNINKTNNQKLAGENKQKHNEKFLYKKYCFGIQKKKVLLPLGCYTIRK